MGKNKKTGNGGLERRFGGSEGVKRGVGKKGKKSLGNSKMEKMGETGVVGEKRRGDVENREGGGGKV